MTSLQRNFQSETPEQRKRRLNNERQVIHYEKRQKTRHTTNINPNSQDIISTRRHELGRMDQCQLHG